MPEILTLMLMEGLQVEVKISPGLKFERGTGFVAFAQTITLHTDSRAIVVSRIKPTATKWLPIRVPGREIGSVFHATTITSHIAWNANVAELRK